MQTNATLVKMYDEAKRTHPDLMIFVRAGDFYETYRGDADIAGTIGRYVVQARPQTTGEMVPMVAIPFFMAEDCFTALLLAGHRLAIMSIDERGGRS